MHPHLSEAALAERWLISRRSLQRWRHLRMGPTFIRLGRRVVYPLAEVEAFEATNRIVQLRAGDHRGSKP